MAQNQTTSKTRTRTETRDAFDLAIDDQVAIEELTNELAASEEAQELRRAQLDYEALDAYKSIQAHRASLSAHLGTLQAEMGQGLDPLEATSEHRGDFCATLGKEKEQRVITDKMGVLKYIKKEGGLQALFALIQLQLGHIDQYVPGNVQKRFVKKSPQGPGSRKFKFERAKPSAG
jgi:hypothetical protein